MTGPPVVEPRSLQVRFELDEIEDQLLALASGGIVEADNLRRRLGAEDRAVEVDFGDIVVVGIAPAAAPVNMNETFVGEQFGAFQVGGDAVAARVECFSDHVLAVGGDELQAVRLADREAVHGLADAVRLAGLAR